MTLEPVMVGTILFATLFILIIFRIPVAFALAIAVIPVLLIEPQVTPVMLMQRMMKAFDSFILLAIPFFILAANIMNKSGITDRLIRLSKSIVGGLPGGLAHVNVFVSMIFAGISGSSTADAAGIGSVLIPAMLKEKYEKRFTVAVTACSSVMGVIIPPSIIMIIWGGVANISVAALFLAGIIPGVLIGLFQMVLVFIFAWKRKYPTEYKFNTKEVLLATKESVWASITPIIIIGGIIAGIVTPTEASVVAVIYSLCLGFLIYKTIRISEFPELLLNSAKLASLSLFAIGTASIYGWVLAYFGIPKYLVEVIGNITTSPTFMLFIITFVFFIVGMFMDAAPAIVILAPLFLPLVNFTGIHPLHFSVVSVITLAFGLITPPYGLCLLIASDIAKINSSEAFKEVGVFLFVMVLVILLLIIFPSISLFIPRLFVPDMV